MIDVDTDSSDVSWSEEHDAYTNQFDDDNGDNSPSVAVAETLEAALDGGVNPLFDSIDPDALDDVVAEESVTVTFAVESATVTVHGDGRVLVRL